MAAGSRRLKPDGLTGALLREGGSAWKEGCAHAAANRTEEKQQSQSSKSNPLQQLEWDRAREKETT